MVVDVRKGLHWMGDALAGLHRFPDAVKDKIGQAVFSARLGDAHRSSKPMRGVNAVEIVSDYKTDTYRCIYTTRYKGHIYVLHCFQKKAKKGSETPRRDVQMIQRRMRLAENHYQSLAPQIKTEGTGTDGEASKGHRRKR